MSTEQDSVQRLAEIRAALETDKRLGIGVGHLGVHIPYLLSLIDSLTAEREQSASEHFRQTAAANAISVRLAEMQSRAEAAEAERDDARTRCYHLEMSSDAFREGWEAAEAEVKRLREALVGSSGALTALLDLINDNEDWRTSARIHGSWSVQATNARSALETASAALATPPSEEGQS